MDLNNQAQTRNYLILGLLNRYDPMPVTDHSLLDKLKDEARPGEMHTLSDVRSSLKFLEGAGLCLTKFVGKPDIWSIDTGTTWMATLSTKGSQFLAGFGEKISGINRPHE